MPLPASAKPTSRSPRALRAGRLLVVVLAISLTAAITAGSASADDLLVLNGDSVTLSGSLQYGLVYLDGDLRLAGDTSISASSIYIGPNASVISCFAAGIGDNGCTAGRSLTLRSGGPLTVATDISLTGGTGAFQPGGNLSLTGGPVAAGYIDTAGSGGAPSGQVSITSTGSLAAKGIYSPGAAVNLTATGPIDVGDDIQTEGTDAVLQTDPRRVQSAAPVTITSSGGDVRIDGAIDAYGNGASGSGGLSGGNAGAVTITGSDVRTGAINATGGGSAASAPGLSAPISITARGALQALGQVDASGQNGAAASGMPGAQVTLHAVGPLTIGGNLDASGGQGGGGGTIALSGASVTTDRVSSTGGDDSNSAKPGGPGGAISVTAPNGASLGSVLAYGGGSHGGAPPGNGGSISVTSATGSIATGSVQTQGGYQYDGPGARGGPITLSAHGDLSVGTDLNAGGSSAAGSASPPSNGGNSGNVTLHADTGTLSLGGNATAAGGAGAGAKASGAVGGAGGSGGQIEVVAHAIGTLTSLSSAGGPGGDYGDTQGPGGPGGPILAWTNAPLFNAHELVSSDGGNGNPTGAAGHQQQDSSPTGLVIVPSTGVLSFTSRSPDARIYRVLMSSTGGAPVTALTTSATAGLRPKAPMCKSVAFTVVAVDDAVGWTSDPAAAVAYRRQPSASQRCSDAPKLTATAPTRRSLRQLRRAHWIAALSLKTRGIGELKATLQRDNSARKHHRRSGKPLATLSVNLGRSGAHVLRLPLPVGARSRGAYTVRLTTTSPDGKRHLETILRLEIVR